MKGKNEILELSFEFALEIMKFCEELDSNKKFVIAQQVLKSGTSIGANIREAQNSESKMDFVHKLKIAAKETSETEYWLQLCQRSEGYPDPGNLLLQVKSIEKLLSKIIASTKRNIS